MSEQKLTHATEATNLADILERVLDKGIVIAGDVKVEVGGVELLNIKIRLIVASVDKAMEMGINWWQNDPALSSNAAATQKQNADLQRRLEELEARQPLAQPA
jgi:hypothetical protein